MCKLVHAPYTPDGRGYDICRGVEDEVGGISNKEKGSKLLDTEVWIWALMFDQEDSFDADPTECG